MDEPTSTVRPGRLALAAMLLAACAILPFSGGDSGSVLLVFLRMLRSSIGAAIGVCLTIGSPHCFALALTFAARSGSALAARVVHWWTIVLHVALLVFAFEVRGVVDEGLPLIAPLALLGFAIVSAARYLRLLLGAKVDLVADVRHGALVIIGAFAWMELQLWSDAVNPRGVAWWVHGTLVTAIFVLRAARRPAHT
jgi:hypothetical protein